jgi:hypothetical protein
MNPILGAAIAPFITYLLSILGIACFAGYAIIRLNSPQLIREKVWAAFVGDKEFNDNKLKSFGQDQLDLMRFRLVYGVSARSVSDLHRLLSWMERHNLTPSEVKRVRAYIDPSKDEPLESPQTKHFIAPTILLALMMAVFVVTADKASHQKTTLITMNVSKTWLWSDGASVEGIWGKSWRLDAQACERSTLPTTNLTGLTPDETMAICKGIADGAPKETVNDGLKAQRRAITAVLIFILLVATNLVFSLSTAGRARVLARRLNAKNDVPGESLPPPVTVNPIEQ